MKLIFVAMIIGNLNITSYRSVRSQTDDSPFFTSIGEHVCKDGVAVSQDLLADGTFSYGDWIYIEDIGLKRVNDTMALKMKNHIDVWVGSQKEERAFFRKYGRRRLKVWKINIE